MNKKNKKRTIIYLLLIFLIFIIPLDIVNSNIVNQDSQINEIIQYKSTFIQKLRWHPKYHDFGFVQEGKKYSTTLEIWNNGTGDMQWVLHLPDKYLSAYPTSGSSSGEHDIINITLDTSNLRIGSYEGHIIIHSAGDYPFYIYFTVTDKELEFSPESHNFGLVKQGPEYQTTFDIRNIGEGILDWNLNVSVPWISAEPSYGQASSENNTVIITVNTNDLCSQSYNESLEILSNGGKGIFNIYLRTNKPPYSPEINGSDSGKIRDRYTLNIKTVDPDDDQVYYLVDWGDETINDENWNGPYQSNQEISIYHKWTKKGTYIIKVKAKDINDIESDWSSHKVTLSKSYGISLGFSKIYDKDLLFYRSIFMYNLFNFF